MIPKYRARFLLLLLGLWCTIFILLLQFSPEPTDNHSTDLLSQTSEKRSPQFPTPSPSRLLHPSPVTTRSSLQILPNTRPTQNPLSESSQLRLVPRIDPQTLTKSSNWADKKSFFQSKNIEINENVHAFYYGWYDAPTKSRNSSGWVHWNHEFIQHWNANEARRWPSGKHDPNQKDIGADFFPKLGPYASVEQNVLQQHVDWAVEAGIGVFVFSWYPPGKADENGLPSDPLVPILLEAAHQKGVKICLHIEPYKERDVVAVKAAIEYATKKYASHPAYLHMSSPRSKEKLPVFYVYDSYHISPKEWRKLLGPRTSSDFSIRGTEADAFVLFLMVEAKHAEYARVGGFDGFYTYFAADGFTYGSTIRNWPKLASLAASTQTVFIPSVGPGYVDVSVRPWNAVTTRDRENGNYYERLWKAALKALPAHGQHVVSITSFNEWHEGTQIEPAVPAMRGKINMRGSVKKYLDYGQLGPEGYLDLTKRFSKQLGGINQKHS